MRGFLQGISIGPRRVKQLNSSVLSVGLQVKQIYPYKSARGEREEFEEDFEEVEEEEGWRKFEEEY